MHHLPAAAHDSTTHVHQTAEDAAGNLQVFKASVGSFLCALEGLSAEDGFPSSEKAEELRRIAIATGMHTVQQYHILMTTLSFAAPFSVSEAGIEISPNIDTMVLENGDKQYICEIREFDAHRCANHAQELVCRFAALGAEFTKGPRHCKIVWKHTGEVHFNN